MSNHNITAIPATLIEIVWPLISDKLSLVVDKVPNELSLNSIKEKALKGETLVVVVSKESNVLAAITLEIKVFDTGLKAMYIPAIGGEEFFEWETEVFDAIKGLSKLYDCQEVRAVAARTGWHRLAKNRQWEEVYTTFKFKL